MEQKNLDNTNVIELNEDDEEQKINSKPNQSPSRQLRDIKKVDYTVFFGDEKDNSEDYESPEEIRQKNESMKKRSRPKSIVKSNTNTYSIKKKKEEKEIKIKKEVEEENDDKKNKNKNDFGHIINVTETLSKYSGTNNDNNIPNSDLILIMLEVCFNSAQFGLTKDSSSRAFWEEVGKLEQLKPITNKFKTETLRKYWRTIREVKKYKKLISEIKRYKNELNDPNLRLLSSIRVICEYVSSSSKKNIEYFVNKHMIKPVNNKKINVNDMTPSEQISDVINTFITCFPKKKEKEIIEVLLKTSFDIQNAFLVLRDKENLGYFCFSEKDDEIVKRNYKDKDDNNEEYQELVNIKGLEDVIRRKEFLFDVTIDRTPYQQVENEKEENELEVVDLDDKSEDKNEEKNDSNNEDIKEIQEVEKEENNENKNDENKDEDNKDKEKDTNKDKINEEEIKVSITEDKDNDNNKN